MNRVKKMMYVRFGLDLLMAVAFVLFFNKQVLGGLTFHEIAGLAIAVAFYPRAAKLAVGKESYG